MASISISILLVVLLFAVPCLSISTAPMQSSTDDGSGTDEPTSPAINSSPPTVTPAPASTPAGLTNATEASTIASTIFGLSSVATSSADSSTVVTIPATTLDLGSTIGPSTAPTIATSQTTAATTAPPSTVPPTTQPVTTPSSNPCNNFPPPCGGHGSCVQTGINAYLCYCDLGYSGPNCNIAGPCITNPTSQCSNRGLCQSTRSPPYYTCICNADYTGVDCSQALWSRLYPYGRSTCFDQSLYGTDDGATPRIAFNQGFLFFGKYLTSVYVNMNGFLSFGTNYMSYTPLPFPHYDGLNVDLLSPFWADADSSGVYTDCCRNDVVYYHTYISNPSRTTPLSACEQRVWDMALRDGTTYVSPTFRPTFVFVATWSNVVPWPYYYNAFSFEKNTFQVVLIMDGTSSKSLVSYRYDYLNWSPLRPAVMGFQTASLTAYNYPGNVYNLANVIGPGSNDLGVAMFVTTGTVVPNAANRCLQWVASQQYTASYLIAQVSTLPACPCSAFQAVFTPGYTWIPGTNCFVSTFVLIYYYWWPWGFFVYPLPYANKCCYETNAFQWSYYWYQWQWMWTSVWLGDLITTPGYEAGNSYMYNPLYYRGDPGGEDAAKRDCCLYSNNCNLYNQVRPLITCARYVPPFFGFFFGDPHVTTLDGYAYDYNGIGEYWLLYSEVVWVQARTVIAWDINNNPVNASVFGAFSIQIPTLPAQNQTLSSRIFLSMDEARQNLNLLILAPSDPNSAPQNYTAWVRNETLQDQASNNIDNVTGFLLTRLNNGLALRMYSGIMMFIRLNLGMLSITLTANQGQLGNNTGGLLGTVNGNNTDDLTLRNGTVMPLTSTSEEIYYAFGESWRIYSNETIMWYPPGAQPSDYQNTSFVPMFVPVFTSAAEQQAAIALCGTSTACLLDYAVTHNPAVANSSLQIESYSQVTRPVFQNAIPIINGNSTLQVQVGVPVTETYTATDANGNFITLNMTGLPPGASFNLATGVFTWTPVDLTPVINLRIDAVGPPGTLVQPILIAVVACNCNGHGNCQFDSTTNPINNTVRFQIAACSCTMGYSGDTCTNLFDTCTALHPCDNSSECSNLPFGQVNQGRTYNCSSCGAGTTWTNGKCVGNNVAALNNQNLNDICNKNNPCKNNATCASNTTYFVCTCLPGYTGTVCDGAYDACSSTPCQNQGTCSSGFNAYNCTCAPGFTGVNCETAINTCVSSPCLNGAACMTQATFIQLCYCVPGYTGQYCQTQIDNCASKPCQNGGVCVNNVNKYTCTCPVHVTGKNCDIFVNYDILTLVKFRVGSFRWSDDLNVNSSMLFTRNNLALCAQFQFIFGKGIGVITYGGCRVVQFRRGSVYALTVLTFTTSLLDLDDIQFANQVYNMTEAYFAGQNSLSIDVNTMQTSVLTYDAFDDPCLRSACSDICFANSASEYGCTCYTGRTLVDATRCRPNALPPSTVDSLALAIALPMAVAAGVALVLAVLYCCYHAYAALDNDDEEEDEDFAAADQRRRRSQRDRFGFGGSDYNDWRRSDVIDPPNRRPASFLAWRLPSRVMGGEPRTPSGESVNFRVARAYQPFTPGRAYQPYVIPAGGVAAAGAYSRPALRRYEVPADEPPRHQHHHHHHQHRRDDDASSIGSDDRGQSRRRRHVRSNY